MTTHTATLPQTGGEGSPDYAHIVHVHGKHRVILCRHGIQWIVQRAHDKSHSKWNGHRFCQTKKALLRDWDEITQGSPQGALENLPERTGLEGA